jgi:hypothetical protein
MESERGWGREYWHEIFDTRAEAQARIDEVNSKNTEKVVPDVYIAAFPDIEVIE